MKPLLVCNTLAIDTLRLIIRKNTLKSLENLSNNFWSNLHEIDYQSQVLTNELQRKDYKGKTKSNRATSIKLLKLNNQNHANSFLIAKTPQDLNIKSNYKKCELSANGLTQTNPTTKDTYKQLYQVFNNKKLSTIDLCIDLKATAPQIEALKAFCNSKYIYPYKGSIYLNKPHLKNIERIIIYDKAAKENINTQWLRVEFTCKVDTKLKDYTPPYNQIYEFISEVFNQSFTIDNYERQIKLLTDGRSYNKRTLRKDQKGIYEKPTIDKKSDTYRQSEPTNTTLINQDIHPVQPNKNINNSLAENSAHLFTKEDTSIKDISKIKAQKIAKIKELAREFKSMDEVKENKPPTSTHTDNSINIQIINDKPPNLNELYIKATNVSSFRIKRF